MGYRLGVTIDHLMQQSYHHAPLGVTAVEDAVRLVCKYEGLEVVDLKVTKNPCHRIQVSLSHRDVDKPDQTVQLTAFEVRNPSVCYDTWERNLEWIKRWQADMAPHLAGLEHNADEKDTRWALDHVKEKTGYEVGMGDLWVHVAEGKIMFGYLTRSGEIAMRKYREVVQPSTEGPSHEGSGV